METSKVVDLIQPARILLKQIDFYSLIYFFINPLKILRGRGEGVNLGWN